METTRTFGSARLLVCCFLFTGICFGMTYLGMLLDGKRLQYFIFGIPLGLLAMAIAGFHIAFMRESPNWRWLFVLSWLLIFLIGYGTLRVFFWCDPNRERMNSCASNLKQLGFSLMCYADENGGWLPPENGAAGLERLRSSGCLTDYAVCLCPFSGTRPPASGGLTETACDYVYYGGGRLSGRPDGSILMMDKPGRHPDGSFHILHSDGTVFARKGGAGE